MYTPLISGGDYEWRNFMISHFDWTFSKEENQHCGGFFMFSFTNKYAWISLHPMRYIVPKLSITGAQYKCQAMNAYIILNEYINKLSIPKNDRKSIDLLPLRENKGIRAAFSIWIWCLFAVNDNRLLMAKCEIWLQQLCHLWEEVWIGLRFIV